MASKPAHTPIRRYTVAEFARLSSSMQLSLLIIKRAQQSSRNALRAMATEKREHGGV